MSEQAHILDPKGRKIPLLDRQGNLSAEAMALYVADGLSATDRDSVDAIAAQDEMTREALDGLLTMAVNHRAAFTSLNSEIAERTGIATVVHTMQREIPWMRIAAGVALLLTIGGITFFASQWMGREQMAVNETPVLPSEPEIESVEQPAEVFAADSLLMDAEVAEVAEEESLTSAVPVANEPTPAKPEEKKAEEKKKEEKKATEVPKPEAKPKVEQPTLAANNKKDDVSDNDAIAKTKENTPKTATGDSKNEDEAARKAVMPSTLDETTTSRQAAKRELQAAAQAEAAGAEVVEQRSAEAPEKPMPFDRADNPPRFPGGDLEMLRFIDRNKNYPETLKNEGVSGAVYVNFVVGKDGKVENVRVVQNVNSTLDEDAMRIVRAMPKWNPAEHAGKNVPTTRTVIVRYE